MTSWFTPPQIARTRRIRVGKVLDWIRRGELVAVNLAEKRGGRPRWRISPEALERFDQTRSSRRPVLTRKPRLPRSDMVTEFF
jgi:hypothetical protein